MILIGKKWKDADILLKLLSDFVKATKRVTDLVRSMRNRELIDLQNRLFGLDDGCAIMRGKARWISQEGIPYGALPDLPIYDYLGIKELLEKKPELKEIRAHDEQYQVDLRNHDTLIFVGGQYTNPVGKRILEGLDAANVHLPFKFDRPEKLRDEFAAGIPRSLRRSYKDPETGLVYKKDEQTPLLLRDMDIRDREPLGPNFEDNMLVEDVILITVLPGFILQDDDFKKRYAFDQKRLIVIAPGLGSGCKIADLLSHGGILESVAKRVKGDYFQAVFNLRAKITSDTEEYSDLVLKDPDRNVRTIRV